MTKQELKTLFEKHNVKTKWNLVEPFVRNSIRIHTTLADDQQMNLGQSKIGGLPDLPKSVNWFEWEGNALSFIAQINCEEVQQFDVEGKLPKSGMLYFFYDAAQKTWGFDPKDKGSSQVYYFDGAIEELERKAQPTDLDSYSLFKPCRLNFESEFNIPDWQSDYFALDFNYDEEGNLEALNDELYPDDATSKLLGHSNNIQDGMETECELVTNGLYCGDGSGYNNPLARKLKENFKNWQLLLQVDSIDEAGMMWGDVGRLYFWIKQDDLENKRFENVWMILQCC